MLPSIIFDGFLCVRKRKGERIVYHIAVLAEHKEKGQRLVKLVKQFCAEKGWFPLVELYENQETFFKTIQNSKVTNVIVALQGVAGLNAVEHLKRSYPNCRLIWCSDLDFSLHAFRIRADYFILEPIREEVLQESLYVCWEKQ